MDKQYEELIKTIENSYRQLDDRNCRRDMKIDDSNCFNQYSNSYFISRSEFSRDRDRILFSRAFRRLEHKAQIYSHERGDHYRTRLTHTLEVLQIAKNISRYLGLNEYLVEAIALGHDIGHTPFGHEGERVLDLILSGKADYKELSYKINYTGFKHNFNSLKVLDVIELKYSEEKGLNLTWQVLEGILKHTKIKRHGDLWCNVDRFLLDRDGNEFNSKFKKLLDYSDSVTLEGQIVAIADEIAQRQHDLDDGMRDEGLGLKYEDIFLEVKKYIKEILTKDGNDVEPKFQHILENLNESIKNRNKEDRDNVDRKKDHERYKRNTIIRDIIEYFICDVTLMSFKNIDEYAKECFVFEGDKKYFNKKLITYSKLGEELDQRLDRYIKNRIVNSNEVNKFDGKANYIIKRLFKAYYSNPRQMSRFTLGRLSSAISENAKIYKIKIKLEDEKKSILEVKDISFSDSGFDEVNNLIKYLKMDIDIDKLIYPSEVNNYFVVGKEIKRFADDQLEWIKNMPLSEVIEAKDEIKFIRCMLEDHYAFLSSICEYISGMTDNYAEEEYRQLYQT